MVHCKIIASLQIVDWDFGKVVIRSLQDMTEPMNTVLSDGLEDVQLASPPVELLIGHKIRPGEGLVDGHLDAA